MSWLRFFDQFVLPSLRWLEHRAGRQLKLFGYGESSGGTTLLSLAVRRPTLFDGIVAAAPILRLKSSPFKWYHFFVGQFFPDAPIAPEWYDEASATVDGMSARHSEFDKLRYKALPRLSTTKSLASICSALRSNPRSLVTPLLVVHGAKDRIAALAVSEKFCQSCASKDKQIRIFPLSGHMVLLGGQPEATEAADEIAEWLQQRF